MGHESYIEWDSWVLVVLRLDKHYIKHSGLLGSQNVKNGSIVHMGTNLIHTWTYYDLVGT